MIERGRKREGGESRGRERTKWRDKEGKVHREGGGEGEKGEKKGEKKREREMQREN